MGRDQKYSVRRTVIKPGDSITLKEGIVVENQGPRNAQIALKFPVANDSATLKPTTGNLKEEN